MSALKVSEGTMHLYSWIELTSLNPIHSNAFFIADHEELKIDASMQSGVGLDRDPAYSPTQNKYIQFLIYRIADFQFMAQSGDDVIELFPQSEGARLESYVV